MKKANFKLLAMFFAAVVMSMSMTACDDDDDDDDDTPEETETEFTISSNITEDETWETGNTYILADRIAVESGVTLTIEPGVVVKGQAGTGSNATALVVAQGATLMAEGTADSPIIFTSIADEIEPGEIASPNLDSDLNGLWGGVIILGYAPISADASPSQIEGIPASDENGLYGGDDAEDNSGVINYISIRHGGANIGEGNEINGLTLGGVGSGTTISNVEVVSNQDDGIEWFGGTVDVSNVIVWNVADDAIDIDQAYAGTVSNFVVVCGDDTDHGLEIDGPEGSYMDAQTVTNGTIKGNEASELGNFRAGARGTYSNIYFYNFPSPEEDGRGDFALSNTDGTTDTDDNFANGVLVFSNLEAALVDGVAVADVFKDGTDVHATAVTAGSQTVGADVSVFADWSWTEVAGNLSDM